MTAQATMLVEKDMTNLEKLLAVRGWTSSDLASYLGITQKSVNNKIKRRNEFKYSEILKIRELFPEHKLDYIFAGYGR